MESFWIALIVLSVWTVASVLTTLFIAGLFRDARKAEERINEIMAKLPVKIASTNTLRPAELSDEWKPEPTMRVDGVPFRPRRRPGVALRRAQLEQESLAQAASVAGRIERNARAMEG